MSPSRPKRRWQENNTRIFLPSYESGAGGQHRILNLTRFSIVKAAAGLGSRYTVTRNAVLAPATTAIGASE